MNIRPALTGFCATVATFAGVGTVGQMAPTHVPPSALQKPARSSSSSAPLETDHTQSVRRHGQTGGRRSLSCCHVQGHRGPSRPHRRSECTSGSARKSLRHRLRSPDLCRRAGDAARGIPGRDLPRDDQHWHQLERHDRGAARHVLHVKLFANVLDCERYFPALTSAGVIRTVLVHPVMSEDLATSSSDASGTPNPGGCR